jgi:hypothetical protein
MSKTHIDQCDVHKTEDLYYRDNFSRGVCVQCLERKVEVLWEKVIEKKGKTKW